MTGSMFLWSDEIDKKTAKEIAVLRKIGLGMVDQNFRFAVLRTAKSRSGS